MNAFLLHYPQTSAMLGGLQLLKSGLQVQSKRLIRKYANRRLYDTIDSKHVTLADIKNLIVSGITVEIIDDTNDKIITRQILLQIINDQEQNGEPLLSEQTLAQLIRFYGNPMQSMMSSFLENSIDTFVQQNTAMQEQFNAIMSASPLSNMQEMMDQNMEAWQRTFGHTAEQPEDTNKAKKKTGK